MITYWSILHTSKNVPPTLVQRAIVTQKVNNGRGEAQRLSSNPTPSQSPRTQGSDGKETKAAEPSLSLRRPLLFAPVLLLQMCFSPEVQQLSPRWC